MSTVVVDAVEHLVRGIVDNPDDVRVDMVTNRRGAHRRGARPSGRPRQGHRPGRTHRDRPAHAGRRHRWPRHPRRRGGHRPVGQQHGPRCRAGRQGARHHRRGRRRRSYRRPRKPFRAPGTTPAWQAAQGGGAERGFRRRVRRVRTVGGCWFASTGSPTATAPTRCAAPCSSSTPPDLPPIEDPDEFYDHQLEGLKVRTAAGVDVGAVAEVLHTAAGELLRCTTEDDVRCWCRSSARS